MLKIVPAVLITAIASMLSGSVNAQGRHHRDANTKVIVVHERKGPKHRVHKHQPPLVIVDTRRLPIRKYSRNRYYYRTPDGYHYWLGANGNLYLDAKFVNRRGYDVYEYRVWERGR